MTRDRQLAREIAIKAARLGGKVYYVGGCVRDDILGRELKDVDIEVHGLPANALEQILDTLGTRIEIGKSFGVYGLKGYTLDIAMPRKESARGRGHRDFSVEVDPWVGTKEAARRRDFTIGALMKEVLNGEIIDHFGGLEDLKNGVLRHVDANSFPEDPLRVLRAAQFAARFNFTVAEETVSLCAAMDLSTLSGERVAEEIKKALLYAKTPSRFFTVLRQMGQLKGWFDELDALIGIPQNPVYHGEGDVWNHTMMVLDRAAGYRETAKHPYPFMLSALVHDFGKAATTTDKNGVLHAYDHECAGVPMVRRFLNRFTKEKELHNYVINMTELHMQPGAAAGRGDSVKSTNRLFDRSKCPEDLILLSLADNEGRIAERPQNPESYLQERLEQYRQTMTAPFVSGKDLVEAGLHPNEQFHDILSYAHKLRLAGVGKEEALKQTLGYARQKQKKGKP
ncbi:MAG: tRNA nucleotidyltransferase [Clostridia bacterium]|nr:tRNA nucleotidyltransferase [Clostridia bacterium]